MSNQQTLKKATVEPQDITGQIGGIFPDREVSHPMYSYARPAYNFWQGFYEGLVARGLSHQQALDELASKGTRWMLDSHEDRIQKLGKAMAKTYSPCVHKIKEEAR